MGWAGVIPASMLIEQRTEHLHRVLLPENTTA